MSKFQELRELYNQATLIYESSLSWGDKYLLIFSPDIYGKVIKLIVLNYSCGPRLSCEDDVRGFMEAFNNSFYKMEKDFI